MRLPAVIAVLLITLGISVSFFNIREKARNIIGFTDKIQPTFKTATAAPEPKCDVSRVCPPDHFALQIRSGAANTVGPKICFEGKIIMSYVLNNVGPGLNIVVVNGENGEVEKFACLNMRDHREMEANLAFLSEIKPGMIVLVASFDDVTPKMTDEMRELFVGMGSTLIKSVKERDNWVFVGRVGAKDKSLYEKQAVNDKNTNIYEGWPEVVEVGGCYPRTLTH